jgi:glycosyltransferase involved in cell wall biosynthesis
MLIACISASRVPSNAANSIQMMKACQALSQLGHELHLFVPRDEQPENGIDLAAFYGLKTHFDIEYLPSRPSLRRYDLAYLAVRRAQELKADLTYVWFLQAGILSLLAHLPVALELHGPPEGRFGPLLFRQFLRSSGKKRLLPITNALASQLSERYHLALDQPGSVQVSPNGVDLERYANLPEPSVARSQLGLPSLPTIGYTGHLYAGRGMSLLLELARRFPQANFLWVGGTEADLKTWRERLADSNISNVSLTGFIPNSQLPLYQAAADILLMPYESAISGSSGGDSSTYASPMKMFEYMACRRPIISSDLPVIREVLNPSNALLCPAGDIEAWCQALAGLLSDETRRKSIANQAWQDIQGYTWLERARKALQGFPSPTGNAL